MRSFLTYLFHKPKLNSYLKTANDMKVSIKRQQGAVDIDHVCVYRYIRQVKIVECQKKTVYNI